MEQLSPAIEPYRFLPRPLLVLGMVGWVLLTVFGCWSELAQNNYPMVVMLFGVIITAGAMAIVASWCVLLLALLWNWCSRSRRSLFRKELLSWTAFFAMMTVLAIVSVLYIDG